MPPAHLLISGVVIGVVLLTIGVFLWYVKRRRAKAPGVCGKCNYNVTGLTTFTCPECGSDLREVGIVKAPAPGGKASRESIVLGLQLTAWTLLYAVLYGMLGAHSYPAKPGALESRKIEYGMIDAYWWPYEGRSTHSVILKPESTAYDGVIVTENRHAKFRGWRHAPVINWTGNGPATGLDEFTLTLELQPSRDPNGERVTPATLYIDMPAMTWHYDDMRKPGSVISGTTAITNDDIYGWINYNNSILVASERVKDEAAALADMINMSATSARVTAAGATGRMEAIAESQRASGRYSPQGYPFAPSHGSALDSYGPGWSIYWLSIPFGLGVYTYGANWIWARNRKIRRKKRRQAVADTPHSLLGNSQQSRTLTILFTDLKDYTSKTAASPREDLLAMLKVNQEIVERAVRKNHGKIMKTIGDAYLATFESATDAVLAGLQIQQGAVEHNRDVEPERHLIYRVAVCTGEVLFTGGDVFGTPVNMAARVQAMAEPGEVYFTESTLHAINSPDVPHQEMGSHELKGIPNPVRIYRAKQKGEEEKS